MGCFTRAAEIALDADEKEALMSPLPKIMAMAVRIGVVAGRAGYYL